ncbi:MAG: DUF2085 domain-containing protein [Anaerolineales bacterium]|nr:MAG: DUF2085 domain-containing protein [Anaerolineales bacterium]
MTSGTISGDRSRAIVLRLQRGILTLSRHWLAWVNLAWGMFVGLPWLAPILMKSGATSLGQAIYAVYGRFCHQMANRSFFLFGTQPTYSYTELLAHMSGAATMLRLKAFTGAPELGYKVAWSDRMVAMYSGVFVGGLVFALLRRRLRSPSWPVVALMIAPMIIDGVTHFISDLAGIGQGFRYSNAWLATLTGNRFAESFYIGTELGSFNSWMRLITGLLFGLATAWLMYPAFEGSFRGVRQALESRRQLAKTHVQRGEP